MRPCFICGTVRAMAPKTSKAEKAAAAKAAAAAAKESPDDKEVPPAGVKRKGSLLNQITDDIRERLKKTAHDNWLKDHDESETGEPRESEEDQEMDDRTSIASTATPSSNEVSKGEISGFVTSAKKSSNKDVVAAYAEYRSCGRFDAKKKQIVALWKSDKSCKWWNSWEQTESKEETTETETVAGYGTRWVILLLCPV